MLLTGDCSGVHECCHDVWVHVDAEVALLDDGGVPVVNPFLHPSREFIFGGGVDDVAEPLLWQLLPVQLIGQVLEALVVLGDEVLDLLDAERVILRDREVLDIIGLDLLLGAGDEILEKIYRGFRI